MGLRDYYVDVMTFHIQSSSLDRRGCHLELGWLTDVMHAPAKKEKVLVGTVCNGGISALSAERVGTVTS